MKSLIKLRRVVGGSMWPTLQEGQIVAVVGFIKPKIGSVVVADIHGREIIKRVCAVQGEYYQLLGDNASKSTDSRQFGLVHFSSISGLVLGFPPSVDGHKRVLELKFE